MFWKRKLKCPIKVEDSEWILNQLEWINDNVVNIRNQETILPTKKYFDWDFSGVEIDAEKVLKQVGEYCIIDTSEINLEIYSEEGIELDRGTITQKEEGEGTSGVFIQEEDEISILIEERQLKNPISLIATVVHELSHYKLIVGKGVILEGEENEWITDLLSIAYGFGIFIGNSKFEFSQFESGDGWGGWQYSIQGYLPQQITAHAMAEIEIRKRSEMPNWTKFLKNDFKTDFEKSMNYLLKKNVE